MAKKWQRLERIVKLKSRWITVYADKMLDHEKNELEYWHFKRADSVIIIPVQNSHILLPQQIYRVGVGKVMLDFPGGRVDSKAPIENTVRHILQKELGVQPKQITSLRRLTSTPFAVDSSFSSQKLNIFVATIQPGTLTKKPFLSIQISDTQQLLKKLTCAQCRLALHEYRITLTP